MSQHQVEPNVTPFLDILLVLLIMFMVMFPMSRRVLEAQLPDPHPAATYDGLAPIVLTVRPGGQYAINTEPVPAARLAARLREVYDPRPDKVLIVRGAPDARYQEVVAAMDVARGAGVKVLGVDRDPTQP